MLMSVERNCPNKLPRGSPSQFNNMGLQFGRSVRFEQWESFFRAHVPVVFVGKRQIHAPEFPWDFPTHGLLKDFSIVDWNP